MRLNRRQRLWCWRLFPQSEPAPFTVFERTLHSSSAQLNHRCLGNMYKKKDKKKIFKIRIVMIKNERIIADTSPRRERGGGGQCTGGQSGELRRSEVTLVDSIYFCQHGYNYRICSTRFHRKNKSFLVRKMKWKWNAPKPTRIQYIFITINISFWFFFD